MRVDQRQADPRNGPRNCGEIPFPFRLHPQHLGGPVLAALEEGRVADLYVREAVVFLDHLNADSADAVETGPADLPGSERFQQHSEPALVFWGGHHAAQGDSFPEGLRILGGLDDRPEQAQDVETIPVAAGLVANEDNARLAEIALAITGRVVLTILEVLSRVHERIERLGGDVQRIAGAHLVEHGHLVPLTGRCPTTRSHRTRRPARRRRQWAFSRGPWRWCPRRRRSGPTDTPSPAC